MVSQRNRVVELIEYIQSLPIEVNIGKTKARGNNGIFMHRGSKFRIDISKNLAEENTLSVLIHELAHYIHYSHDKKMKSLDFIFGKYEEDLHEELIEITVQNLPKEFASSLFNTKNFLNGEVKQLAKEIRSEYQDFKISEPLNQVEKKLKFPYNYLLKYDKIRVFTKTYSIAEMNNYDFLNETEKKYIQLKSKQRQIKRINSKISRLNKYYNNSSELFARFTESYFLNNEITKKKAPRAYMMMENTDNEIINNLKNIMFCKTL